MFDRFGLAELTDFKLLVALTEPVGDALCQFPIQKLETRRIAP